MNECKNAGRNDLTKYFKKYLLQLFFSIFFWILSFFLLTHFERQNKTLILITF